MPVHPIGILTESTPETCIYHHDQPAQSTV
jgi:hypothetical protein